MAAIEPVYRRVGRRLRQIREASGLTQEQLARGAGLNRAYVGFIERAERRASLVTLQALANALDADIRDFFDIHED